jgi:putative tryptophan/tyrosine transport system substrate-binding protein
MRRRDVVALWGAALAYPATARAQSGERRLKLRVGWLAVASNPFIAFFRQGMAELGHREGGDFLIEERDADGRMELLPQVAAELVNSGIPIIVAVGSSAALAAWGATRSVPIVTLAGDPVRYGMAESFARPGGNVTGLGLLNLDFAPKWLEILHEVEPSVTTVAVLVDNATAGVVQFDILTSAAKTLGKKLVRLQIDGPEGFEPALAAARREGAGAMIAVSSPLFHGYKQRLIAAAAEYRLPAMYEHSDFPTNGGLLSYGPDFRAIFRRLAFYVDRIAAGAKPGDLPLEQPTKLELIINLRTAKALGLSMPPTLLARADEVIE